MFFVLIETGDGDEFGIEFIAVDVGGDVVLSAGEGTAAQGAVNGDVAVSVNFRAGADGADDDQVAAFGHDALTGADVVADKFGRRCLDGRRGERRWRGDGFAFFGGDGFRFVVGADGDFCQSGRDERAALYGRTANADQR